MMGRSAPNVFVPVLDKRVKGDSVDDSVKKRERIIENELKDLGIDKNEECKNSDPSVSLSACSRDVPI